MVTIAYTVERDSLENFYVRTPAGELHSDEIGVIVYDRREDAYEVAEALTEGRPIRPLSWRPAPVADPLTVSISGGDHVLYSGSLERYRGLVFTVYDSECHDDCGGYELDEPNDGSHVQLSHVSRRSITLA